MRGAREELQNPKRPLRSGSVSDGPLYIGKVEVLSASPTKRALVCALLLVCTAALDFASGTEVSFSIFYLVPVSFASAVISYQAGVLFAVLSAGAWGFIDVTSESYSAAWIPYWNTVVRLIFFQLVNELIKRLHQGYARQHNLAREDTLTGIANKRVFEEYCQRALGLSHRYGQPFTVAYIDLDRFKQVNDTFGHSEGDELLRRVAFIMSSGVRPTDVVARLGGDEFGILMSGTDFAQAHTLLQRIASLITEEIEPRWGVGVTVGAVTFTEAPADVGQVLSEADALMYQGKRDGRGCVRQSLWPDDNRRAGPSRI